MLFITGYTETVPYIEFARRIEECFKIHKLEYKIYKYENKHSWLKNVHHKINLMLQACLENPEHNICWIDCDAEILEYPELIFDLDASNYDFALYWRRGLKGKLNALSGTIYLKNSPAIIELLEYWIKLCENNYIDADDTVLDTFIDYENRSGQFANLRLYNLGPGYCKLQDRDYGVKTIIAQFRASEMKNNELRRFKCIRYLADKTIRLIREDVEARKYLDNHFDRLDSRTWVERSKPFKDKFFNLWQGTDFNIIGKGKSLTSLTEDQLLGLPTICVNDSLKILEAMNYKPLFGCVQDEQGMFGYTPVYSPLFCSVESFQTYKKYLNAYSYTYNELHVNRKTITAVVACKIAQCMGARKIRFLAFDAHKGILDYADGVGITDSNPNRLLSYIEQLKPYGEFID